MRKKESGAVLIVSLIILFVLTLVVLAGSRTVLVQEKMTAAVRDLRVSLEIAESGVSDAEAVIEGFVDTAAVTAAFSDAGANGLYTSGNGPSDLFAAATWAAGLTSSATTIVSGTATVAQYFIEDLGLVSVTTTSDEIEIQTHATATESEADVRLFKIVSRTLGNNGNTERIVVSYYGKSF